LAFFKLTDTSNSNLFFYVDAFGTRPVFLVFAFSPTNL